MIIKKVLAAIRKTMDEVSTPPNKRSYYWKDSFSLISWIILETLFIARCFSLLQWIKYFVRKEKKKDDESKRPNVPSIVVELYYMILCIGFISIVKWEDYIPSYCDFFIKVVAIYFLIDSIIWVLYYFIFRRFFEEKYAIMHTLEYIVVFPFVIILQACCFKLSIGIGVSRAASMLINPDANTPLPILTISVIYTAVILGLIINALPIEKIKEKGVYRYHLLILGYGEVVRGKLLGAVVEKAQKEKNYKNVVIYDYKILETKDSMKVEIPSNLELHKYEIRPNDQEGMALFHKRILASNILWIATPPHAHLDYLNKNINHVFIVVEKPIVTNSSELAVVKQLRNNSLWKNVFCLSYYYLEKALPLTYLYSPYTFYEEYLDFNKRDRQHILSSFEHLGKLKSLELTLFEEIDNRDSVDKNGGQVFETFLHLGVLARAVIGENSDFGNPTWIIENKDGHGMSHIHCIGDTTTNVHFDLEMRKDMLSKEQRQRKGKLTYEKGTIEVDFDRQDVSCKSDREESFLISTKQEYTKTKYSIQVDMVRRCFEEGIVPTIIDGSSLQINTLEWLFAQRPRWQSKS